MKTYNLGIVGFGTVGQGIARLLATKQSQLQINHGFSFRVVGIADPVKGMVYNPNGIPLQRALDTVLQGQRLEEANLGEPGWDSLKLIHQGNLDILLEITPTNLKTGEPGITHLREALSQGIHVATTNKGPIALAYAELRDLAEAHGAELRFEGTVLSGTPVFNLWRYGLACANIQEIQGILNGTTNYILTRMAEGLDYEAALQEAQQKGYAETDPTADVEGYDALAKAVILANVILGGQLKPEEVPTQGITGIHPADVQEALKNGQKWKLLVRVWREGGKVQARVAPQRVDAHHPLYGIDGVTNALTFYSDTLGTTTIVGPGAGSLETGHALLMDLLDIHRTLQQRGTSSL